jgi:O-antigen/teichoic acid export membrane protein
VNRTALRRLAQNPTVAMSASIMLVAVAGYAFLSLGGHLADSNDKAAMTTFYVLVNTVGQGVFIGLEQELNRSVSHAQATGSPLGPVVRRAFRQTAMLLGVCLLLIAGGSPLLVAGPLHGAWPLIGATLIGTCTAAASYCARGLLGGTQQFGGYSVTLLMEGGSRLVLCGGLLVAGAGTMLTYSYAYALGLAFAAAVGFQKLKPFLRAALADGSAGQSPDTESGLLRWVSASLLFLVGAGLLTQLVANLPALGASSRLSGPAHSKTAAAFVSAATLARIPVLLTGPVTALLLPRLTAAGAKGAVHQVRSIVLAGVAAMVGLGAVTAVGVAALGPWVLAKAFDAHGISALELAVMAVGTAGIMAVSVLQPALLGLGRQRLVPIAWGVGAAAMTAAVVWPVSPVTAAVVGSLVGPTVVAGVMGLGVLRGVAAPPPGPHGEADAGQAPDITGIEVAGPASAPPAAPQVIEA